MTFRFFNDIKTNWEIIPKSNDVIGFYVLDRNNEEVGEIQDLLANSEGNNTIDFALIGKGWAESTFGTKHIIVPLGRFIIDKVNKTAYIGISRDRLLSFPDYALDEPDLVQKINSFWKTEKAGVAAEGRTDVAERPAGYAEVIAINRGQSMEQIPVRAKANQDRVVIEQIMIHRISETRQVSSEEDSVAS
ncbi:MAG: PRC-barrel domain-containing protein [Rubrobacteridae bacterium]|nr:PRC-barrel domain-containing protein [Rubrobacteridae bacterium]